jgi:hypothetical protein
VEGRWRNNLCHHVILSAHDRSIVDSGYCSSWNSTGTSCAVIVDCNSYSFYGTWNGRRIWSIENIINSNNANQPNKKNH